MFRPINVTSAGVLYDLACTPYMHPLSQNIRPSNVFWN